MKVLAVIPARGGSKGVPHKNIRVVGGRPLIAWSIEAVKNSRLVDYFCVSTDDEEIAAVARSLNANVLPRPAELAGDYTPMIEVVQHALRECERHQGVVYDYFLLLQPTAPMRKACDVDAALMMLAESKADSITSVYQVEDTHPARMYLIKEGALESFCLEPTGSLRQDLPNVYHRNGAIYGCRCRLIKDEGRLLGGRIVPYIMPRNRSVNIDDMQDLAIADFLMSQKEHN